MKRSKKLTKNGTKIMTAVTIINHQVLEFLTSVKLPWSTGVIKVLHVSGVEKTNLPLSRFLSSWLSTLARRASRSKGEEIPWSTLLLLLLQSENKYLKSESNKENLHNTKNLINTDLNIDKRLTYSDKPFNFRVEIEFHQRSMGMWNMNKRTFTITWTKW